MEKKLVYRKLEFEGEVYYQLYKILDNDEEINVSNTKPGKNVDEFYCSGIEIEDEIDMKDLLYTYYLYEDNNISIVDDPIFITELSELFYNKFKDFDIIPKNDLDIDKIMKLFEEQISFQSESALEFLNIIKSNLDIIDTDMSNEKKAKLKHNILLYGPKGFGKSTLMNCILNNVTSPCTVLKLKPDVVQTINSMIVALSNCAMNNLKKAENGIVLIKDNFDELEEILDEDITPSDILESLLNIKKVILRESLYEFDLSKITFVFVKNTTFNSDNSLYSELSPSLIDCFDELICFDRLTKEQIKDIIENNPNSSINLYREICQKVNKELIIESDFLDTLIERAYYDIGGIELINNYIEMMIKTRWCKNKIILDRDIVIKCVEDSSGLKELYDEDREENSSFATDKSMQSEESSESGKFKIDLQNLREN